MLNFGSTISYVPIANLSIDNWNLAIGNPTQNSTIKIQNYFRYGSSSLNAGAPEERSSS